MKNENIEEEFNTASVLTEQDYKDIEDIKDIRTTLLSFINLSVLIDEIVHLIEINEYIDFKNERSRKFIDKKKPIFNISINREVAMSSEKYNKDEFISEDDEVKYFADIIFKELTSHITDFIRSAINNNEEIKEYIYSKQLFRDLTEEEKGSLNNMAIISLIFASKHSKDDKAVVAYEILI